MSRSGGRGGVGGGGMVGGGMGNRGGGGFGGGGIMGGGMGNRGGGAMMGGGGGIRPGGNFGGGFHNRPGPPPFRPGWRWNHNNWGGGSGNTFINYPGYWYPGNFWIYPYPYGLPYQTVYPFPSTMQYNIGMQVTDQNGLTWVLYNVVGNTYYWLLVSGPNGAAMTQSNTIVTTVGPTVP